MFSFFFSSAFCQENRLSMFVSSIKHICVLRLYDDRKNEIIKERKKTEKSKKKINRERDKWLHAHQTPTRRSNTRTRFRKPCAMSATFLLALPLCLHFLFCLNSVFHLFFFIIIILRRINRLTGVNKSGVADADDSSVVNLIPEPKSKSQILIGHNFSVDTQRIFSGFKSRCAMPFLCRKSNPDAISLMIWAASCSEKQTCSWILVSNGPPLI